MQELNINLTVAAFSLGLAFSICALADSWSDESCKVGKDSIKAEYQAAKASCVEEAKAAEIAAKGETKAAMKSLWHPPGESKEVAESAENSARSAGKG